MKAFSITVVVLFCACVAMCVMLSNRCDTISANVDDIHKDATDTNKALLTRVENLEKQVVVMGQIIKIQNDFVNKALKTEMGEKDFEKFVKEYTAK